MKMKPAHVAVLSLMIILMATPVLGAITFIGDNVLVNGANYTDDLLIQDSVNVTFTNSVFSGDVDVNNSQNIDFNRSSFIMTAPDKITVTGSTGVGSTETYFNTDYAPLHATDINAGCADGDGIEIIGVMANAPWSRNAVYGDVSNNCKPTIDTLIDQTGNLNNPFVYDVNCSDPNADILAFTDNSPLFVIGAATGIISFTPTATANDTINVTCSDSEYISVDDFVFTVEEGSGYMPLFTGAAVADVAIDGIVGIGAALVVFASVIAVILVYYFAMRKRMFARRRVRIGDIFLKR